MGSYHLGSADFDPDDYEIRIEGQVEHLQPQVRKVLLCLLRHPGQVVTKETLLNEGWSGRPASDECLTRCISLLRKHLQDREEKHLIETIPRVGYRLRLSESPKTVLPSTGPPATGNSDVSRWLRGAAVILGIVLACLAIIG